LKRLWSVKNNLRQLAQHEGLKISPHDGNEEERFDRGIAAIGKRWSRAGYDFVPLVTPNHELRCSLDILLLRPGEDRLILRQGDIDGQIKTLFDGLRIPENLNEIPSKDIEAEENIPMFCLLSDDRLISEVRVNADELLMLPTEREVKASDSFVAIHVRIGHKTPRTFDRYFD
jgi:hypothetical protein